VHKNYRINNTTFINHDDVYDNPDAYPDFQHKLEAFKDLITSNNKENIAKTYFKFGDGDYYFLKKESFGSATPGRRALRKPYYLIPHKKFVKGSLLNDYYLARIEKTHQEMFKDLFKKEMDFPSEFVYGLTSNKWFLSKFKNDIGIIGADRKLEVIQMLMEKDEYKNYLQLDNFSDYITIPQKFAVDKINKIESQLKKKLENSSSKIFLLGVGHVKSALLHQLSGYKKAQFIDIGVGVDALAGIVNNERPYFGNWNNYRIKDSNIYEEIDFLINKNKIQNIKTHNYI